jgi:hypothetical protein
MTPQARTWRESPALAFLGGEWQDSVIQEGIAMHNSDVRLNWLLSGGDATRQWWWHVTELTLDNFRPSPKRKQENEELQLAKDGEAVIERGLKDLAKRRRKEQEKMRMLREVAELFKRDWARRACGAAS